MALIAPQNDFHTAEVNWGPLSETMSRGRPRTVKITETRSSAVSQAVGSLGRGR